MKNFSNKIFLVLAFFLIVFLQSLIHKGVVIPDPTVNISLISIRWYSLFMLGGVALMVFVFNKLQESHKELKEVIVEDIIIYSAIPGIILARLWHVITDFHLYSNDIVQALYIWNGGLSIFGGVIGVILGMLIYSKRKKINLNNLINAAAFALPLAQVIGRYGNLFNRELYGQPTELPWGIHVPLGWPAKPSEYTEFTSFHPAYLYEQIGNLIVFVINLFLYKRVGLKGNFFVATWLTGYGIVRFIVEFFRIERDFVGTLSFSQVVSLVMIIIGIMIFIFNLKRHGK